MSGKPLDPPLTLPLLEVVTSASELGETHEDADPILTVFKEGPEFSALVDPGLNFEVHAPDEPGLACQNATSCRHPFCRVMQPEGRVERPRRMVPRIEREVDQFYAAPRAREAPRRARVGRTHRGQEPRQRRRERGWGRALLAGDGGGGSAASSFGLSLGR